MRETTLLLWILLMCRVSLAQDGTLDNTFNPGYIDSMVVSVAIQPDQKVLIGGKFSNVGGVQRRGLARLKTDGTLDSGFLPYFYSYAAWANVYKVFARPDGKIFLFGDIGIGASQKSMLKLNSDGSLDPSFKADIRFELTGKQVEPLDAWFEADGKILIVGYFLYVDGVSRRGIARLNPDGSLDPSFNPGTGFADTATSTWAGITRTIMKQGSKYILGGMYISRYDGNPIAHLCRIYDNGSFDNTFVGSTNNWVVHIAEAPGNKYITSGRFTNYTGITRSDIVQSDKDGYLLSGFTGYSDGKGINKAIPLSDGKLIIIGDFISYQSVPKRKIARLNTDGSPDNTFAGPGFSPDKDNPVVDAAMQADGKIVVVGLVNDYNGSPVYNVLRINNATTAWLKINDPNISEPQAELYPNPANQLLHLKDTLNVQCVIIYDMMGTKLYEGSAKAIDVANFSTGIYCTEIIYKSGEKVSRKFVKN